jgi:hypothetical protein
VLFARLMGIKRAIKEVCNYHFWQQKFPGTAPSGLKLNQLVKWACSDIALHDNGLEDLAI